jgi:hypothetical protein
VYRQAAEVLESESGYILESPTVTQFRKGILDGDWATVERLLGDVLVDGGEGAVVSLCCWFLSREMSLINVVFPHRSSNSLSINNASLNISRTAIPRKPLPSYAMNLHPSTTIRTGYICFHRAWQRFDAAQRQRVL